MSRIRDPGAICLRSVRKTLLSLLRYNENSSNPYSDSLWIVKLLESLAASLVPAQSEIEVPYNVYDDGDQRDTGLRKAAMAEIERHQRMDRWIPSFQNVVTRACLEAKQTMIKAGLLKEDLRELMLYTRGSNLDLVRVQAFRILLQKDAVSREPLTRYVFETLITANSLFIKSSLISSLTLAIAMKAVGSHDEEQVQPTDINEMIVEEDVTDRAEERKAKFGRENVNGAIKALRSACSSNVSFRACIWLATRCTELDISLRLILLDICRLAFEFKSSLLVVLKFRNNTPRLMASIVGKGRVIIRKQLPLASKPVLKPAGFKIKLKLGAHTEN